MKAQRLRFRYRITEAAVGLGHREIVGAWEEAARVAGLELSYSQGKRPAPQISLAAPLARGATSDCELVDLYLEDPVNPKDALRRISGHFPPGVEPFEVREVGVSAESVQTALRWAEYEVEAPIGERSEEDVRRAIACLLAAASAPTEYRREGKVRAYDLRPLVIDIRLLAVSDGSCKLWMRLKAEQENTARADQVLLALGFGEPTRMHRSALSVGEVPGVIQAFRRAGEREN